MATVLTLMISAFLYVQFGQKMVRNLMVDVTIRKQVAKKIASCGCNLSGSKGKNLTLIEYKEISKYNPFPGLSAQATHIEYSYQYEDFLPDYKLHIVYYVPLNIPVDTINDSAADFSRFQSFKVMSNRKKVVYEEIQQ